MPETQTTTRAYTLRLSESDQPKWRELIWSTHCIVNRGVWIWGDWLLTLRGGLSASLADRHPERRAILALSWLSVETPESLVPPNHIVARGDDEPKKRAASVNERFGKILNHLKVTNRQQWIEACEPALAARIRDDAVWVDRWSCFQDLATQFSGELSHEWATATFFDLIGGEPEYFSMPDIEASASTEAKDFVIKAGNWLSANWGSGAKSDSVSIAEALEKLAAIIGSNVIGKSGSAALAALAGTLGIESAEDGEVKPLVKRLKHAIGWKGRPSKGAMALAKLAATDSVSIDLWNETQRKLLEEAADQSQKTTLSPSAPAWMPRLRQQIESRIGIPYRTAKDHIWEYAVMLDHALRRVSAAHTWIKRAEARRKEFDSDAVKIHDEKIIPVPARDWLDVYCERRLFESGAANEYLIRRRAVVGWEEVVRRWRTCKTKAHRLAAARDLQSDVEKFGDIQLFEAIAADDALQIWKRDGKSDPTILLEYVAARAAEHDQRRFKVPAYRHPDPLRHPVWVDFGNSRWSVRYSVLEAIRDRGKLQTKLAKAKADAAREKIADELAAAPDLFGVTLGLWTGEGLEPVPLRWHSKRLRNDLCFDCFGQSGPVVSRADRFGRAFAREPKSAVNIAEVFDQKEWNGRLQAKRSEFDRLADLIYGKKQHACYDKLRQPWPETAKQRFLYCKWFLSYSAKLCPAGPWLDYVQHGLPQGWSYNAKRAFLNCEINQIDKRQGRTRFRLARLPNLRILSFDLGHRYAAACAVWQTLSERQFKEEIAGREIVARGAGPDELYAHTRHLDHLEKSRTTVYRRIGPSKSSDAVWARLNRQFLIKLQGEDRPARYPVSEELAGIEKRLKQLGRKNVENLTARLRVDELMSLAIGEMRQALRRHGDIARVANAFQSSVKQLAGGRTYYFFESNPGSDDSPEKRAENYRQFLLDALITWHQLKESRFWEHDEAKIRWSKHIEPLISGEGFQSEGEEESAAERKRRLKNLEERLRPIAGRLAEDQKARQTLADEFSATWQQEELSWKGKDGHLRWLRRFILPRLGKKPDGGSPDYIAWKERARAIRHVGGLSVDRLATILKLYQVLRAFHSRPEPSNLRAGIERIEEEAEKGFRFGQRILDTLERLRESRIKQLASRLVEAALGIGSENSRKHWEGKRKTRRPRKPIDEPQFAPCHAIVAEDLDNYRPEQTRLRVENKRIRDWAARNVRKYIVEGCQLNGLHFVEVPAAYTSRQDSRTGAPGFRAMDVPLKSFLNAPWWKRTITGAQQRLLDGGQDSRDKFLDCLHKKWINVGDRDNKNAARLRIPIRSGDLFVSANPKSPAVYGLQADLNAAANIGLKALTDPDWPAAWWYVPVKPQEGTTDPKDFPGCPLFKESLHLLPEEPPGDQRGSTAKSSRKTREKVNVWRDVSAALFDNGQSQWMTTPAYWNWVEKRVIGIIAGQMGLPMKTE